MNPDRFIAVGGPSGLATAIVGPAAVSPSLSQVPAIRQSIRLVVKVFCQTRSKRFLTWVSTSPPSEASHFMASASSVPAPISGPRFLMACFGIRRTVLHSLLLRHAQAANVRFLWNTTFRDIQANSVAAVTHD